MGGGGGGGGGQKEGREEETRIMPPTTSPAAPANNDVSVSFDSLCPLIKFAVAYLQHPLFSCLLQRARSVRELKLCREILFHLDGAGAFALLHAIELSCREQSKRRLERPAPTSSNPELVYHKWRCVLSRSESWVVSFAFLRLCALRACFLGNLQSRRPRRRTST